MPDEEEEHESVAEHRQNPDNDEEHETKQVNLKIYFHQNSNLVIHLSNFYLFQYFWRHVKYIIFNAPAHIEPFVQLPNCDIHCFCKYDNFLLIGHI